MTRQAELTVEYKGVRTAMGELRRQCAFYLKGMQGAAELRNRCGSLSSLDDLKAICDEVLKRQ